MPTERLLTVFRQDEEKWKKLYNDLYHFQLSRHIDIPIRQLSANRDYPAFFFDFFGKGSIEII